MIEIGKDYIYTLCPTLKFTVIGKVYMKVNGVNTLFYKYKEFGSDRVQMFNYKSAIARYSFELEDKHKILRNGIKMDIQKRVFVVRKIDIDDFYRLNGETLIVFPDGSDVCVDNIDDAKEYLSHGGCYLALSLGWMTEDDFANIEDKTNLTIIE